MNQASVDQLIAKMWAGDVGDTFALLDAARSEQVYSLLRRSRLDYLSLFLGKLAPELAATSPYIVHLGSRSRETREILTEGWGDSWAVFFRSHFILQDLRRHFRRLLQVEDDSGKKLFFRFYDPRVLRAFLPTCRADELEEVFGPVERFMMESASGDELLVFSNNGGLLSTQNVPIAVETPDAEQPVASKRDSDHVTN